MGLAANQRSGRQGLAEQPPLSGAASAQAKLEAGTQTVKRVLLDTHLALWWLASDRRLGAATRQLIETSACAVSVASLAEVAMKVAAGKLRLPSQPLDERLAQAGIALLALTLAHGKPPRA